MTEEMGIILSGALEVLLVLALIVIGPACMILMVHAGEKDEKRASARTEYGERTHKYYAAEYSRLYRWSRAVVLFYVLCILIPLFPVILIETFEISFIKSWQGFLIFAVLGLAAEVWILKKVFVYLSYVTVESSGLTAVYRDGKEKYFSLSRFESYEKRRNRGGSFEVLIFKGEEKDEELHIYQLGEESADHLHQDIQTLLQYGSFT